MNQTFKSRRGLIALNAVLLAALGAVTLAPSAQAQRGARARGEYTMVSGRVTGSSSHAVYVIDSANQEMIALTWNQTRKGLEGLGYRDLNSDSGAAPGR